MMSILVDLMMIWDFGLMIDRHLFVVCLGDDIDVFGLILSDVYMMVMIFNTYDKIKDYTMKNILNGYSSANLVLSIKNSFNNFIT